MDAAGEQLRAVVEQLRVFVGQSDKVALLLLMTLGYIMKGWVSEYAGHQREKAMRRRANAKEGAFEWTNIKREIDEVVWSLTEADLTSLTAKTVREEVERRLGLEQGDLAGFRKQMIEEVGDAVERWPENHFEYEEEEEDGGGGGDGRDGVVSRGGVGGKNDKVE